MSSHQFSFSELAARVQSGELFTYLVGKRSELFPIGDVVYSKLGRNVMRVDNYTDMSPDVLKSHTVCKLVIVPQTAWPVIDTSQWTNFILIGSRAMKSFMDNDELKVLPGHSYRTWALYPNSFFLTFSNDHIATSRMKRIIVENGGTISNNSSKSDYVFVPDMIDESGLNNTVRYIEFQKAFKGKVLSERLLDLLQDGNNMSSVDSYLQLPFEGLSFYIAVLVDNYGSRLQELGGRLTERPTAGMVAVTSTLHVNNNVHKLLKIHPKRHLVIETSWLETGIAKRCLVPPPLPVTVQVPSPAQLGTLRGYRVYLEGAQNSAIVSLTKHLKKTGARICATVDKQNAHVYLHPPIRHEGIEPEQHAMTRFCAYKILTQKTEHACNYSCIPFKQRTSTCLIGIDFVIVLPGHEALFISEIIQAHGGNVTEQAQRNENRLICVTDKSTCIEAVQQMETQVNGYITPEELLAAISDNTPLPRNFLNPEQVREISTNQDIHGTPSIPDDFDLLPFDTTFSSQSSQHSIISLTAKRSKLDSKAAESVCKTKFIQSKNNKNHRLLCLARTFSRGILKECDGLVNAMVKLPCVTYLPLKDTNHVRFRMPIQIPATIQPGTGSFGCTSSTLKDDDHVLCAGVYLAANEQDKEVFIENILAAVITVLLEVGVRSYAEEDGSKAAWAVKIRDQEFFRLDIGLDSMQRGVLSFFILKQNIDIFSDWPYLPPAFASPNAIVVSDRTRDEFADPAGPLQLFVVPIGTPIYDTGTPILFHDHGSNGFYVLDRITSTWNKISLELDQSSIELLCSEMDSAYFENIFNVHQCISQQ